MSNNTSNDFRLLKESFCDFFSKVLPFIPDPEQTIRKTWIEFREFMLSETHSPLDVFLFVQKIRFPQPTPRATTTTELQKVATQPRLVFQPWRAQQPVPIGVSPEKQRRKNSDPVPNIPNRILSNRVRTEDATNLDRFNLQLKFTDSIKEEIEKVDLEEILGSPKNQQTFPKKQMKHSFPMQSFQVLSETIANAIRKNGVTLGCVYDRSHEINTGDREEKPPLNTLQLRFAKEAQEKMANYDQKQLQRNMPFKECSIYSKQRGAAPLQRAEQAIQKEYQPSKAYQGRKDGRKVTGKKLFIE